MHLKLRTYIRDKLYFSVDFTVSGILSHGGLLCRVCGGSMTAVKMADRLNDGICYRCPKHKAVRTSIRVNSILNGMHISLGRFILLVYFWALQIPLSQAQCMSGLNRSTVIAWYAKLRAICKSWLADHPPKLGGPGRVVQLDETVVARRKIHHGRMIPTKWLFGGIDSTSKECFLVHVRDRSEQTWLSLIQQFIEPGSVIHTDESSGNINIGTLPVKPPYIQVTVTHREHFNHPKDNVGAQNIEGLWHSLRMKFKKTCGVPTESLDDYLEEFMWRQVHGKTAAQAYGSILNHIAMYFPT